jgi:hypothetical protein|tara:strand:- start:6602 stop:6973 length:372 start_codon:yes stop_codon:yes gene_type:complete
VKNRLIQITQPLFKRLGLRLLRDKDYQRLQQNQTLLTELVHQARQKNGNAATKDGISFIIFSKDRASLNTTLNRLGEPMVCSPIDALNMLCSPIDALNMLYGSDLQFLIMEKILVRKPDAPTF